VAFTLSRAGPKCNTPKENLLDAIENNNIKEIKSVLQNLNKSKKWILFEYIILMKKNGYYSLYLVIRNNIEKSKL